MSNPPQADPQEGTGTTPPAPPNSGTPAPPNPPIPESTPPRSGDSSRERFDAAAAFERLSNTVTALPEQIVNAVRETGAVNPPAPVVNPPAAETIKKRTFADWWFSKS
jgi:hypothetical protein